MEKLDFDQLEKVSGGRTVFSEENVDVCYKCGKKSDFNGDSVFASNSFGIGFSSIYDKNGEHKLCPSCYEKWSREKFEKI